MPHIKITTDHATGPFRLIIDDVDVSNAVFVDGFCLKPVGDDPEFQVLGLQVTFAVDTLDVDLPEAALVALREGDDRG